MRFLDFISMSDEELWMSIILFSILYLIPLIITIFRSRLKVQNKHLIIGAVVSVIVMILIFGITTRIAFYKQGQYYNYGVARAILLLILTVIFSSIISITTMKLIFNYLSKKVKRKLS